MGNCLCSKIEERTNDIKAKGSTGAWAMRFTKSGCGEFLRAPVRVNGDDKQKSNKYTTN
jgi:hypothetical protein